MTGVSDLGMFGLSLPVRSLLHFVSAPDPAASASRQGTRFRPRYRASPDASDAREGASIALRVAHHRSAHG
jgi:hypothetical protein